METKLECIICNSTVIEKTKTSSCDLPHEVLKGIADLAIYWHRDFLPKTNFEKCHPNRKGPLLDLHTEFAHQLCLTDSKDIEEYCIPGIALIIPTVCLSRSMFQLI